MGRLSTGISGLDSLIEGGIPVGSVTLLSGNPGTGKTISSSHFIYEGLTSTTDDKDNGVYISFSESKSQFYQNSYRFGMDFENYETQNRFKFLDFVSLTKDGIQDALEEILSAIRITKAKRVVLDSFTALSLALSDKIESRIAIHVFLGKLMRAEGITSLVVIEIPYGEERIGVGVEESIVDAIIRLEHGEDNASPFYMKILKMRGTKINKERHVCNIINGRGMILYSKQNLSLIYPVSEERVSTGIPGFDERIDNDQSIIKKGLIKGTFTAIIGATGSAKSTFAFQFVANGIKKYNDSSIFCSLEDSVNEIKRIGTGYGYDISDLEKKDYQLYHLIQMKKILMHLLQN